MKKTILLFLSSIFFLNANTIDSEDFEKELAYFFSVENPEPVINGYIAALTKIEELGIDSPLLEQEVLPNLEESYNSISQQRNWNFNTHEAAKIELAVILGNAREASPEIIESLMVKLYQLIYHSDSFTIQKAAMLRTFIYQYKARVLKNEGSLTLDEKQVLLKLGKLSEKYLISLESR